MPSKPLDIGDLSFARKGDAAEHFRQILRRHDPGVALSEPDATHVYWLLERHPEAAGKIGAGVKEFSSRKAMFDTRCSEIRRIDMTALCYFNALRELGRARRIVEDEVRDRVSRYGTQRRRVEPPDVIFADRQIKAPMELTSRESTDKVAEAKQRLEAAFGSPNEVVEVALATNMISVGLDITRLGLILVQGQPKTAAEYIQATSRVGRDHDRPGLVAVVLNVHKPRDRMHFEQFCQFHSTFYRAVEATSVTPWAARALDLALAAIVVAAARHVDESLTPDTAVSALKNFPLTRQRVRDAILSRAPDKAIAGGRAALALQIDVILDAWIATADDQAGGGDVFAYAHKKKSRQAAAYATRAGNT